MFRECSLLSNRYTYFIQPAGRCLSLSLSVPASPCLPFVALSPPPPPSLATSSLSPRPSVPWRMSARIALLCTYSQSSINTRQHRYGIAEEDRRRRWRAHRCCTNALPKMSAIFPIFRRHQADQGLLLAALGAQQRHPQDRFSFAILRPRQS